jgi:tRNA(adenine34) deaminase
MSDDLADAAAMAEALSLAREALAAGDHPYGAVIILREARIAERNRVVSANDPTAHSEVMAIRAATASHGLASTVGASLITTFEPCPMCLGAILETGITRLVIGGRRRAGEAPLGNYTVERLLALTNRHDDLAVSTGPLAPEIDAFYRSACRTDDGGEHALPLP